MSRDHAHRRQDHDVHGRVRIEPEQVLPQQRLPAAGAGVPVAERAGRPAAGRSVVPMVLSSSCRIRATVSTGRANACRMAVMNMAQMVIGMR